MKGMEGVWRISCKPRIGADVVNRWCLPCGRRLQVQRRAIESEAREWRLPRVGLGNFPEHPRNELLQARSQWGS